MNSITDCSEKCDVTNLIDRQFVKDIVDLLSSFILQVQYVLVQFYSSDQFKL